MCSKQCASRHSVSSQTCCKLVLQLFNGVRPLQWLSGLIIVSHEIQNNPLQLISTCKMVRLEEFALQQREPDLNLIKPGSIFWQPIQLHREFAIRCPRQLLGKTG